MKKYQFLLIMFALSLPLNGMDKPINYQEIKHLLDTGGTIRTIDDDNSTILFRILSNPPYTKEHEELTRRLLDHLEGPHLINKKGTFLSQVMTSLEVLLEGIRLAGDHNDMSSVANILHLLLSKGENPHVKGSCKKSAIVMANELGLTKVAEYMSTQHAVYRGSKTIYQKSAAHDPQKELQILIEQLKKYDNTDHKPNQPLTTQKKHKSSCTII